ncbi:MAG: hypothetical protein KF871_12765 [Hydrogenophaga sp.]|uniref:hypothetical protein n=1 Tax=Hydrogenophaga sp. TaxID=1904254 RepID=UPI001DF898EF|nr:hypothetical protein [Hydrogenophaga sp.]MBX3610759.1 hypothetical protein [Hydrogenophaga sp.]
MSALDFLKVFMLLGILGAWAFNRWLKEANQELQRQTAIKRAERMRLERLWMMRSRRSR